MEQLQDTSWAALTNVITWRDLGEQYLSALQHCEAYCAADPGQRMTNVMIATMGGLSTVYVGLRPILDNPSRYDDPAEKTMANCVLALCRKIRRYIPLTPPCEQPGHA